MTWLVRTCDLTHSYVWHDSFICVTWLVRKCDILIRTCDMTHSYVWHDSFVCVTWLIHMCDLTHSYVWHDSFVCVTWLDRMFDMIYSYVWHDSFVCDMTHLYVWPDSFVRATWLIRMCDMTNSTHSRHGIETWPIYCVTWLIPLMHIVTWLIHMCDMTHPSNIVRDFWTETISVSVFILFIYLLIYSCNQCFIHSFMYWLISSFIDLFSDLFIDLCIDLFIDLFVYVSEGRAAIRSATQYFAKSCCYIYSRSDMGWLRLVGPFKLQVSSAENRLFYRALLHKRPMILRSYLCKRRIWGGYD